MPTLTGADVRIFWFDNSAAAFDTDPGATACYEIEPIDTASIGLLRERLNKAGLGSRTRKHKNVIKIDPAFSMEFPMEDTANYNWDLAKMIQDTTGTSPSQVALLIWFDTNRDGVMDAAATDFYIWAWGAFVNELGVTSNTNEEIKLKVDFLVSTWNVSTTKDATFTGFNSAASDINIWLDGDWTKTAASGWTTTGAVDEAGGWSCTIKNNMEKRFGWTVASARSAEKGGMDVTGSVSIDLHDKLEIDELTGEKVGDLTLNLNAADFITVTDAAYDTLGIDLSPNELIEQEIEWTGDSVVLT